MNYKYNKKMTIDNYNELKIQHKTITKISLQYKIITMNNKYSKKITNPGLQYKMITMNYKCNN